jgi:hypothetical protein
VGQPGASPRIVSISWGRMEVDGLGVGKDFKRAAQPFAVEQVSSGQLVRSLVCRRWAIDSRYRLSAPSPSRAWTRAAVSHLGENVAAAAIKLTPAEVAAVTAKAG